MPSNILYTIEMFCKAKETGESFIMDEDGVLTYLLPHLLLGAGAYWLVLW